VSRNNQEAPVTGRAEEKDHVEVATSSIAPLVELAVVTAGDVLGKGERLAHTAVVARRAQTLAAAVHGDEVELLVATAWLHDIGYADGVRRSGFHPLDGARYLWSTGWPSVICELVVHHSGARFVAAVRGLGADLASSDSWRIGSRTRSPWRIRPPGRAAYR
jgi:predicted hydrolase (HD superfamily)